MARILLADDDQELRNFLAMHLKAHGHEVILAADGMDAVEAVKAEGPDLVILDMDMPRLTGWDAVRRIKDGMTVGTLPVVALSAHHTSGDKDEAHEAGCDIYLEKPVQAMRLIETLDTLLG